MSSSNQQPPGMLERAFRSFPYALFIVVAGDRSRATGMVATWATQVSFHPPMAAVAIESSSRMRTLIDTAGAFSINFLPPGSRALASRFLKAPSAEGGLIAGEPVGFAEGEIPCLASAAVTLACRVRGTTAAGDHVLYLGEVIHAEVRMEGDVLTLGETGWRYYR